MVIEDLRNVFTSCRDELIEVSGDYIYYAEEKVEEGHNILFLLEYNRKNKRERIITSYILQNPSFVHHYYGFPNDILIVMENGDSEVWVLRVDKLTGAERNLDKLGLIGAFNGCAALNASHLLFFTVPNEKHKALFRRYTETTGMEKAACLYDLDEKKPCYVRDPRICAAEASGIIPFDPDGLPRLLILLPHGDEEEKETCYRNQRWLGDSVCDRVWECPLFDLIVSLKAGETHTPLELLFSAGTSGLVRYAGMDEEKLYFRARYFPTNDQRVLSIHKQTGKKEIAAELNLKEGDPPAGFLLSAGEGQPFRVYRIIEEENRWRVEGQTNSNMNCSYNKELGEMTACVEDRYLIARYILSDETVSYEFNSIVDSRTGRQQSYEGRCCVWADTVVLY